MPRVLVVIFLMFFSTSAYAGVMNNYGCNVNGSIDQWIFFDTAISNNWNVSPLYYDELVHIYYQRRIGSTYYYYNADTLIIYPAPYFFQTPASTENITVTCEPVPMNLSIVQDSHSAFQITSNDYVDYRCSEFQEECDEYDCWQVCTGAETWVDRDYSFGGFVELGESIHIAAIPLDGYKIDSILVNGVLYPSSEFDYIIPGGIQTYTISVNVSTIQAPPVTPPTDIRPLSDALFYRTSALTGLFSAVCFAFSWKG